MRKLVLPFALLTVAAFSPPVVSAQAAAARTFVSAAGSDSNNCANVATPCRHLATAYAATAPNGEIYVLDPANYGALTITGPVSIEGHGWASIAPVANSAAITINANAGDKINIIGVVLDGTAISNTNGIQFNSGGALTVRDSVIRNFTGDGIDFGTNSTTLSQVFVSNTLVSDNGGNGINITVNGIGTTTSGALDHVHLENNGANGLTVTTGFEIVNVVVSDSVIAGHATDGIFANSLDGAPSITIVVRNCIVAYSGNVGLHASNSVPDIRGSVIRVTRSTITGNAKAWDTSLNGGLVTSYGDNNIDGNANANTEPPNPLTYK
jgi:hypothetical protein